MTKKFSKLPPVIEPGEQDMAPKNNIEILLRDSKHGVGTRDAINKFDILSHEDEEEGGPHIIEE